MTELNLFHFCPYVIRNGLPECDVIPMAGCEAECPEADEHNDVINVRIDFIIIEE